MATRPFDIEEITLRVLGTAAKSVEYAMGDSPLIDCSTNAGGDVGKHGAHPRPDDHQVADVAAVPADLPAGDQETPQAAAIPPLGR